jgi:hypothetical protein
LVGDHFLKSLSDCRQLKKLSYFFNIRFIHWHWLTLLLCIRQVPGSTLCPGDRLCWLRFVVVFLGPCRRIPG